MKCLRCGYCCIQLGVVIIKPDMIKQTINLESEETFMFKESGKICPNLYIDEDELLCECLIHHYTWYDETPCHSHGQIEESPEDLCRMGEYLLLPENKDLRLKMLGR